MPHPQRVRGTLKKIGCSLQWVDILDYLQHIIGVDGGTKVHSAYFGIYAQVASHVSSPQFRNVAARFQATLVKRSRVDGYVDVSDRIFSLHGCVGFRGCLSFVWFVDGCAAVFPLTRQPSGLW